MKDKIVEISKDLIRFKSVAENKDEIQKCLQYCTEHFKGKNVFIKKFENPDISPVLLISNYDGEDFDVLTLGHVDVVPAEEGQFTPEVKDGKLFGRGSLDMKTWVAVGMNSLDYILENNLGVKFGIIITTDEETSATGATYLAKNSNITAKILLDVDVADDIGIIVTKCKNVQIVELIAEGEACHGSLPWHGEDAIQGIVNTINNLREKFPYYSKSGKQPEKEWVDTMHVGLISGGRASNVVADKATAILDFRLTEKTPPDLFNKIMQESAAKGVNYKVKSQASPVIVDENNPYFKKYKETVEKYLGHSAEIVHIGGATDSRHFSAKGMPVVMHSGTGYGMHGVGEYCTLESIEQLANIQIDFIKSL